MACRYRTWPDGGEDDCGEPEPPDPWLGADPLHANSPDPAVAWGDHSQDVPGRVSRSPAPPASARDLTQLPYLDRLREEREMVVLCSTENCDFHRWAFTPDPEALAELRAALTRLTVGTGPLCSSGYPRTVVGDLLQRELPGDSQYEGFSVLGPYRDDASLLTTVASLEAGAVGDPRAPWVELGLWPTFRVQNRAIIRAPGRDDPDRRHWLWWDEERRMEILLLQITWAAGFRDAFAKLQPPGYPHSC